MGKRIEEIKKETNMELWNGTIDMRERRGCER